MPGGSGVEIPNGADIVIKVWNLMGGEINWSALPFLCEMHGIKDIEEFVHQLAAIREYQAEQRNK